MLLGVRKKIKQRNGETEKERKLKGGKLEGACVKFEEPILIKIKINILNINGKVVWWQIQH